MQQVLSLLRPVHRTKPIPITTALLTTANKTTIAILIQISNKNSLGTTQLRLDKEAPETCCVLHLLQADP